MVAEHILLKQLAILLISAVKFLFAAPASYLLGYSYIHTFLNIFFGGLLGVMIFYFAGKVILYFIRFHLPLMVRAFYEISGLGRDKKRLKYTSGNYSSRRNRWIVRIRRRFGYTGLIILTPVLFSIPVGTFLALKYFSRRKNLLFMLSLSVFVWSLVLASLTRLL
ncbi:MAG: hypothetical protein RBS07_01410 [Lentimicrobium sp.]|jgi:uncharacterized membrane protein|nr:hypothetical protein [Lentimicrobium sp.]